MREGEGDYSGVRSDTMICGVIESPGPSFHLPHMAMLLTGPGPRFLHAQYLSVFVHTATLKVGGIFRFTP